MGERCLEHGYVKEAFIEDVILREGVSSTAFTDALAMPHAIRQYAERSFICVIHNSMPIHWGRKHVHFIFMVGITRVVYSLFLTSPKATVTYRNSLSCCMCFLSSQCVKL